MMMHRFKVGDWIYMEKNPTTMHVQGKLHRIERLDEGGYYVSSLATLGDDSSFVSEGLAIDASNDYYVLTVRAKIMGIPDNLALAEYIQNLELRLMR